MSNSSNNLKNLILVALLICSISMNLNKNQLKPSMNQIIFLEQNSTTSVILNDTNTETAKNTKINSTSERILKEYNPVDGEFQYNKNHSIEILVILFLALILFRIIVYYFTPTNVFFKKCFSDLIFNTFSYFLAIAILIIVLSLTMTIPKFTWAGIIIIAFTFVFFWILFLSLNIILGYFMCEKWKMLESQASNFSKIFIYFRKN